MKNNKGISSVVATVSILLITVLAVGILAGFVVPYIKNQLGKSTECVDFQSRFTFERGEGINCINSSLGTIIAVKANGDKNVWDKVAGFDIVLKGNGFSKVFEVRDGMQTTNMKMYNNSLKLVVPESGEFYSYVYSGSENFTGSEIKTVMISGRVCELVSDKLDLEGC